MNQKDKLEKATIKALTEYLDTNYLIYKIILKDNTEVYKVYNNLKEAQEEAEKLDAKCVKSQYKDNSTQGLFNAYINNEYFIRLDRYKYENNKFYIKTNFGWNEENNQDDYYKMSINLSSYLIGKRADPYSVLEYNTYLIVDISTGIVYEKEDIYDYKTLKEIKADLQTVLDGTYGENIYQPYYFDPLNY